MIVPLIAQGSAWPAPSRWKPGVSVNEKPLGLEAEPGSSSQNSEPRSFLEILTWCLGEGWEESPGGVLENAPAQGRGAQEPCTPSSGLRYETTGSRSKGRGAVGA